MKRYCIVLLVALVGVSFWGCGKKQQSLEEMQAPASIESLDVISKESKTLSENPSATVGTQVAAPVEVAQPETGAAKLEPLPPGGPYKPSATEIQTALKNSGYYAGSVDGKLGPKSKKAIEEFQKANGLKPDGKVGTKTWAAMEKYLTSQATKSLQ